MGQKRGQPSRGPTPGRTFRRFLLLLSALLAAGAVVIWWGTRNAAPPPRPGPGDERAAVNARGIALGREDAPVVIYEFSDYQCPYCAESAASVLPGLRQREIPNGTVRYVFVDFPLPAHPHARPAARAARCAGEQGRYWEMHDRLFAAQGDWSASRQPAELFRRYAGELGLDADRFAACLDSNRFDAELSASVADGERLQVQGTPTLFVNGRRIDGAVPLSALRTLIEQEARSAPGKSK